MAIYESYSNTSITSDVRVADPFDPSNLTLVELAASTTEDWAGFYISSRAVTNTIPGIVIVATGTSTNEVMISATPLRPTSRWNVGWRIYIPVPVPSGTRITVGVSVSGTANASVLIGGVPDSNDPPIAATPAYTVFESGPYILENVSGTYADWVAVDPGATADTKGSYVELSESGTNGTNNVLQGDSLTNAYGWLGFAFSENINTAQTLQSRLWDVATGVASSEVDFIEDEISFITAGESTSPDSPLIVPVNFSATTRISARMSSTINDATDRIGSVIMMGPR